MLSFFPRDVFDEVLNLIESVSGGGGGGGGGPSYSSNADFHVVKRGYPEQISFSHPKYFPVTNVSNSLLTSSSTYVQTASGYALHSLNVHGSAKHFTNGTPSGHTVPEENDKTCIVLIQITAPALISPSCLFSDEDENFQRKFIQNIIFQISLQTFLPQALILREWFSQ